MEGGLPERAFRRSLNAPGVPYLVGRSLASSLHGIPRATQDVDIVARLTQRDLDGLVTALKDAFHLDEAAIREAVEQRTSFNLIHLGTLLKVDILVAKEDEASRSQMQRRFHHAAARLRVEDLLARALKEAGIGD